MESRDDIEGREILNTSIEELSEIQWCYTKTGCP